jgi:hypothetical protein
VDLRRPRLGDWVTGLAGLVLVISLFLPWFETGAGTYIAPAGEDAELPATRSAWEAFTVIDVLLLLVGLLALAVLLLVAFSRMSAVPVAASSITAVLGLLAVVVVAIRLIFPPGVDGFAGDFERSFGAWIGLLSVLGLFAGAVVSMRDERARTGASGGDPGPEPELRDLPARPRAGASSGAGE